MFTAWVKRLSQEFGCTDGGLAPQNRQGPRALPVAVGNDLPCCQVQAVQRRRRHRCIAGCEEPAGAGGSRWIQMPLKSQILQLAAEKFGKQLARKGTPRELRCCQLEASNKASNKLIYCDGQRAGPHFMCGCEGTMLLALSATQIWPSAGPGSSWKCSACLCIFSYMYNMTKLARALACLIHTPPHRALRQGLSFCTFRKFGTEKKV